MEPDQRRRHPAAIIAAAAARRALGAGDGARRASGCGSSSTSFPRSPGPGCSRSRCGRCTAGCCECCRSAATGCSRPLLVTTGIAVVIIAPAGGARHRDRPREPCRDRAGYRGAPLRPAGAVWVEHAAAGRTDARRLVARQSHRSDGGRRPDRPQPAAPDRRRRGDTAARSSTASRCCLFTLLDPVLSVPRRRQR